MVFSFTLAPAPSSDKIKDQLGPLKRKMFHLGMLGAFSKVFCLGIEVALRMGSYPVT